MEFPKSISVVSSLRLSSGTESQQTGPGAADQPPWKSHSVARLRNPKYPNADEGTDETAVREDMDIVRKARNIFNRITSQNKDKMVAEFLRLEFKKEQLESVRAQKIGAMAQDLNDIVQKCIQEGYPSYLEVYAQMIKAISDKTREKECIVPTFRKQMLYLTQQNFQKYCGKTDEQEMKQLEEILAAADDDNTKLLAKIMLEGAKLHVRQQAVGNIHFLGQLYNLGVLSTRMVDIVGALLGSKTELTYECICELLTVVGPKLEVQFMDRSAEGRKLTGPPFVQRTFMALKSLSTDMDNNLSPRVRFALMNVCELRDNDWKPRPWRLEQATSIPVSSTKQSTKGKRCRPSKKFRTNVNVDEFIRTILEQFESTQEIDIRLIKETFNPGGRGMSSFAYLVKRLSFLTVNMDDQQLKIAGRLVNCLLQRSLINRGDVIHGIRKTLLGVLRKPTDSAKTVRNLATFLVETFLYQPNLAWLVELKNSLEDISQMKTAFVNETVKVLEERLAEDGCARFCKLVN